MLKKLSIAAAAVCLMAVGAAAQTKGSFTDTRDNQIYRTVKIGKLTWMAENLNYVTDSSWCYDNADSNCVKYGRLYTWDAAMAACPAGWRLPDGGEWNDLMTAVGGNNTAGTKLKAKTGWNEGGNGTDEYGFSSLPGGGRNPDGNFDNAGSYGFWWGATDNVATGAWNRFMGYDRGNVHRNRWDRNYALSVRCVQGDR